MIKVRYCELLSHMGSNLTTAKANNVSVCFSNPGYGNHINCNGEMKPTTIPLLYKIVKKKKKTSYNLKTISSSASPAMGCCISSNCYSYQVKLVHGENCTERELCNVLRVKLGE